LRGRIDVGGDEPQGLRVETVRELPAFVEARVSDATDTVLAQWVRDSAYRFFPLIEHDTFGGDRPREEEKRDEPAAPSPATGRLAW
jgi:hypothetical protein